MVEGRGAVGGAEFVGGAAAGYDAGQSAVARVRVEEGSDLRALDGTGPVDVCELDDQWVRRTNQHFGRHELSVAARIEKRKGCGRHRCEKFRSADCAGAVAVEIGEKRRNLGRVKRAEPVRIYYKQCTDWSRATPSPWPPRGSSTQQRREAL